MNLNYNPWKIKFSSSSSLSLFPHSLPAQPLFSLCPDLGQIDKPTELQPNELNTKCSTIAQRCFMPVGKWRYQIWRQAGFHCARPLRRRVAQRTISAFPVVNTTRTEQSPGLYCSSLPGPLFATRRSGERDAE